MLDSLRTLKKSLEDEPKMLTFVLRQGGRSRGDTVSECCTHPVNFFSFQRPRMGLTMFPFIFFCTRQSPAQLHVCEFSDDSDGKDYKAHFCLLKHDV